nr:DMT family transporter [Desulfotomaculum copahuensis]
MLVAASAVCFSFTAVFAKLAYAGHVNLTTLLFARFILAALVIWAVIACSRQSAATARRELGAYFFLALLGYGIATSCLFASLRLIPASLASMLLYTHPALVAAGEVLFYRRPLTGNKTAALVMSAAGLLMVLGTAAGKVSLPGVLLALGASLSYAAYLLLGNRVLDHNDHSLAATGYVLGFAALGFGLYGLFSGQLDFGFQFSGWIWITALAVVATVMAIILLYAALTRIEAGRAAIISTLEPVLTVIMSALIFRERLGPWQVTGGLLVLTAIMVLHVKPPVKGEVELH